ncbi:MULTISPECIES: HoxN/HupN/NixA family nickel/cobalt transporter [unclassified Pseudofrankia]|uniref:HoxN/HupN/NixA family nickel/cobalt transporter n=1 Tax=unclassified Pseudofrankia TaxID=2994372 RepID=UPI0008DA5427|nr:MULTISPECIES: HoxN/HupN/NixA family nickel/cobalt transporter [unclassified Pseudofrankia]MDT3440762.1 HoxN/HupN/NixA family nickel/cobalt transporter [Pseudofrankia sp. BMG5.37]OHV64726.1 nickel transporter [Pseudofrankia sp. BMG5.36]
MAQAAPSASEPSLSARLTQFRQSLSSADKRSLAGMTAFIVLLHVLGFVVLLTLVTPRDYHLGGDHPIFTAGVGVLAYTFGLRHAFDADHIAAVDNATRKLIADNVAKEAAGAGRQRRPLSVGFWFSLGHSTIVFVLAFLLSVGVKSLVGPVEDDSSRLHTITSVIGPSVSGVFLWVLGILNLAALIGIIKVFREMRNGRYDEQELERRLDSRGFMNRFLGGLTKAVTKPWKIYPIGVLFGLGFDTATEVGLLVLAGGSAAFNLPFYSILVLPILFAAGMCLMDTIDGVFMNAAYGWAFARPVRKVFYNLTITTISVIVALVIGTIELVGVLADRFTIESGPLAWIAGINLDYTGYAIVGLFFVAWGVALAIWYFGRVEERWSANLTSEPAPSTESV